jgi:hypothetical protein
MLRPRMRLFINNIVLLYLIILLHQFISSLNGVGYESSPVKSGPSRKFGSALELVNASI